MHKKSAKKTPLWQTIILIVVLLAIGGGTGWWDISRKKGKPSIVEASMLTMTEPKNICVEKLYALKDSVMPEILRRKIGLEDTTRVNRDTLYSQYLGLSMAVSTDECWQALDGNIPKDLEKIWVNALVVDAIIKNSSTETPTLEPMR